MKTNNPGIHRLKIEPLDIGHAKVSVDDTVIRARKVDVHMEVGSAHTAEISLIGEPEMDFDSLITFDFSPKTVKKAVDIMVSRLLHQQCRVPMSCSRRLVR